MELSDYVASGTWTLIDAPAEIRVVRSTEPPYESRTEMVFFMSEELLDPSIDRSIDLLLLFSYSTEVVVLYDQSHRSDDDDYVVEHHSLLFAERCCGEDDGLHVDSRRLSLLHVADLEDSSLDFVKHSLDLEILDVHIPDEYSHCLSLGCHSLRPSSSNSNAQSRAPLDADHLSSHIADMSVLE